MTRIEADAIAEEFKRKYLNQCWFGRVTVGELSRGSYCLSVRCRMWTEKLSETLGNGRSFKGLPVYTEEE